MGAAAAGAATDMPRCILVQWQNNRVNRNVRMRLDKGLTDPIQHAWVDKPQRSLR
jgi:hypothetical protein